jgi:translation elongation factor EF-G
MKVYDAANIRNVAVIGHGGCGKTQLVSSMLFTVGTVSRRGCIGGMETRGAMTVVKAQVPMAEMLTYEQHLTSETGGRGTYHMEYSHYEEVPQHLQEKIISATKAKSEDTTTEDA